MLSAHNKTMQINACRRLCQCASLLMICRFNDTKFSLGGNLIRKLLEFLRGLPSKQYTKYNYYIAYCRYYIVYSEIFVCECVCVCFENKNEIELNSRKYN